MGDTTEISWTDSTFNPVIGCQHVSPGCDHCYAEAQNAFRQWTRGWGPHGERRRTSTAAWRKPLQWNADAPRFQREHGRRRRVFCASLADVFDNQWLPEWRADLFATIRATPALDWQLLTKRPQNIARMLPPDWGTGYPNVWLGTTTEAEPYYRQRWPVLAAVPANVRFVSYEPAIGALGPLDLGDGRVPDWLIDGGESGGHARIKMPDWSRSARDQCAEQGVAYFLKQHGTYASNPLVLERGVSVREAMTIDPPANGKGGALLDGRLWRDFPYDSCSGATSTRRLLGG